MITTKKALRLELMRIYKMSEKEAQHRVENLQHLVNELEFNTIEDLNDFCNSYLSIDNGDFLKIFRFTKR